MPDGSAAAGAVVAVAAGLAAGAGAAILIKAVPLRAASPCVSLSDTAPAGTALSGNPASGSPPSGAGLGTASAGVHAGDQAGGADATAGPNGADAMAGPGGAQAGPDGANATAGPGGRAGASGGWLRAGDWLGAGDWLRAGDWLNAGDWLRTGGWRRPESLAAIGLTAVIFAAWWLRFGLSPLLPALCYLAIVAVALAFIDARHRRLPDLLTLPSYPVALVLLGIAAAALPGGGTRLLHAAAGLAAVLLLFVLQAFIYPAGVGWGDVKLSGLLGLYLGWFGWRAVLAGLLCGYLLAAVYGAGLLVAGRATRKSMLPFGPFLLAGTVAVLVIAAHSAG